MPRKNARPAARKRLARKRAAIGKPPKPQRFARIPEADLSPLAMAALFAANFGRAKEDQT